MKQTRKIGISEKVFTVEDLRRLASIFDEQATLAKESDQRAVVEYSIRFSDDTTIESDSSNLFSEESFVVPARCVAIRMSFRSYELDRAISLSLNEGESRYGNEAAVGAIEPEWLAQNFLRLKETLDAVRPQSAWLRKHKTLLLNLIAVGVGCLWLILMKLLAEAIVTYGTHLLGITAPPLGPQWQQMLSNILPVLYLWQWVSGYLMGLIGVSNSFVAVEHVA